MRIRAAVSAFVALVLLAGCASPDASSLDISVNDVTSASVALDETPRFQRVVALANGSAEVIDSLGMKTILVGRDIASTDPSLESVPIVTSGHQVIAEKIIALNPDLVIIDGSVGPSQAITALRSAGIRVVTSAEVWKVEDITTKVIEISQLIGAPRSGDALASKITQSLAALSQSIPGSPRVAFLYLRGGNSIYLLGGKGSGADSLLNAIGATDVGSQISTTAYAALTSESFAQQSPDILLVMTKGLESVGGVAGLLELPGISQTPAGKNKRVISVDDSLLLSFGPRTPDLLSQLAKGIREMTP